MTGYDYFGFGSCTLGAACGLHALRAVVRRRAIRRDGVRVKAEVISLTFTHTGDDDPDYYRPVVRFADRNSQSHDVPLLITPDTKKYRVGRKVPIIYQADKPQNVINPDENTSEIAAITINTSLAFVFLLRNSLEITSGNQSVDVVWNGLAV